MEPSDKFGGIRKGLLELVVLSIISKGRVYAADILERLSKTEWKTQEGTLYPLLSRLRREKLVTYDWVESASGPPRKYYALTAVGTKELHKLTHYTRSLMNAIESL